MDSSAIFSSIVDGAPIFFFLYIFMEIVKQKQNSIYSSSISDSVQWKFDKRSLFNDEIVWGIFI